MTTLQNNSPESVPWRILAQVLSSETSGNLAKDISIEDLESVKQVIVDRITLLQADNAPQQADSALATTAKKSRWDSDSDDDKKRKKQKKQSKSQRVEKTIHQSLSSTPCKSIDDYILEEAINEGTYGEVWKAVRKATGEIVALKRIKWPANSSDGFPLAALRETNVLFSLVHPSIVHAREMVIDRNSSDKYPHFSIYMAMDYFPHDLATVMEDIVKRPLHQSELKCLMVQLLDGLAFMHERWYMHRDLKPSNLLYQPGGRLVICDFGLTRQFSDPQSKYTAEVVTLHYRSPELLLAKESYATYNGAAIDLWAVGCIFAELLIYGKLFPGDGFVATLNLIWGTLGTPVPGPEPITRSWPEFGQLLEYASIKITPQNQRRLREKIPGTSPLSPSPYLTDVGMDFLDGFLMLDPRNRRSAIDSANHPWVKSEEPAPKEIGRIAF